MPKVIRDSTFIGEGGIAVVQHILMEMRFAWQPTGRFDVGIDGYIELRDSQTQEMLGAHLGAQVKARAKFTRETDTTFEFLCDQEDVDYWLRSTLPVLLICVRSGTEDAWYVCVTDYFADSDVRAERRVVFDKEQDRFDARVANALRDRALPLDAGVPRQGLTGPETLLTNLLPVVQHGTDVWSAPTECETREDANARYAELEGSRASDYLLGDGRLYSLRDPRTCELARICEASESESQDVHAWAGSKDDAVQRRFADLLRRTLLQQLKPRIQWQPEKGIFYFAALDSEDIGLVADASAIASAQQWMQRCAGGVRAKEDNSYPNLWQPFPGFNEATGFGASLIFTERLHRAIRTRDINGLKPHKGAAAVRTAVDLYLTEIETLAQSAQPRVIVCVMPQPLLQAGFADKDGEEAEQGGPRQQSLAGQFHDLLKAEAMRYRVPLQLMRPSTYDPTLGRGTIKRAPLQDEATRAWNFLTALYYKAGGTPWRMVRDDAALESCYVGVSFYWRGDGSVATSVAQVFNERGDGVVVRGGPATRSTDDRQLHLREEDAYELLDNALRTFRAEHRHLPARIVVHKTTPFDGPETEGMMRAVDDQDVGLGRTHLGLTGQRRPAIPRRPAAPVARDVRRL